MPKKKLAVGVPASLNLKAELERAQSESRLGGSRAVKGKSQQLGELGAANSGVDARARQDRLALDDESGPGARSSSNARKRLEEKARIYDMLAGQSNGMDAVSDVQGVDAEQLERILEESSVDFVRMRQEQRAQTSARDAPAVVRNSSPDSDGSIVEIVDEFGRSRMVPRRRAGEYIHGQSSSESDDGTNSASSADDGRGAMGAARRNDSVGYYRLSADYVEREDQLAMLRSLHSETTKSRREGTMSVAEMQMQQRKRRRDLVRDSLRRTAGSTAQLFSAKHESRAQSPHCE
ncbi:hypothetical protein H4R20_001376 [Coemansia guatemalensis]|uniref:Uncharacterized protein n=1 Tax=Coemansia guatemalensis TaxID=2761395 RepID=A0A9W8I219_9FUNG|nr:hypothetical protein H4R20_001376 [Coemansia guatemalensis]